MPRALFDISTAKRARDVMVFFDWRCASPRAKATCNFSSSDQMAPHLEKRRVSRLSQLFGRFRLLSPDSLLLFSDSCSSLTLLTTVAASVHKSEVWLLSFLSVIVTDLYWGALFRSVLVESAELDLALVNMLLFDLWGVLQNCKISGCAPQPYLYSSPLQHRTRRWLKFQR